MLAINPETGVRKTPANVTECLGVLRYDSLRVSKQNLPLSKVDHLPSGLFYILHAYFDYETCSIMRPMRRLERGQFAAKLLLADWIMIAKHVEAGVFNQTTGFVGVSPLVQPHTLRQLGAETNPGYFNYLQTSDVGAEHELMTGMLQYNRAVHEFSITNEAMVEGLPAAISLFDRLESRA